MLNVLKFIMWSIIAIVAFIAGYMVWHNLKTRQVRHQSAQIAGNVQYAIDNSFEAVLAAQSGVERNLRGNLLAKSTGDPFNRKLPAYVFSLNGTECGQVFLSRSSVSGRNPSIIIGVNNKCPKVQRHYLYNALKTNGILQVWDSHGLVISTKSWSPQKQALTGTKSPLNQSLGTEIWDNIQKTI